MGFLDRIFKRKTVQPTVQLVRENAGGFGAYRADLWSNPSFRAGVDVIARHISKASGTHVIQNEEHLEMLQNCRLTQLLTVAPNPSQSMADFLYGMVARLYRDGNSYAYLDRNDKDEVIGVYPVYASACDILSNTQNELFYRFNMQSGSVLTFRNRDIIHLRRHFIGEHFGDSDSGMSGVLQLSDAELEGQVSIIEHAVHIRGILKSNQLANDQQLKARREQFMQDFFSMQNNGGIISIDDKSEFVPLESHASLISPEQTKAIEDKVFAGLGINRDLVTGKFDENTYGSFYEGVVEPILNQLSQQFSSKCFSPRALSYGNRVVFGGQGRMLYASNSTKATIIKELVPLGILSLNDARRILGLQELPSEEDRRVMTLNVVNVSQVDEYQKNMSGAEV